MKNTFELEHVGINTENEEEAMKMANLIGSGRCCCASCST